MTATTSVGKSASDANTTVTVLPADPVAQQSALDQIAGTESDEISGASALEIDSIVSPPGTYLPAGAPAPIADPGGTYSAAGASAPTTDPAGTYSSPYALDRFFLVGDTATPDGSILSFNSAAAVAAYYGAKSGVGKPNSRTISSPAMATRPRQSCSYAITRQAKGRI